MSFKQPKFKQKNVKPKKDKHSKKFYLRKEQERLLKMQNRNNNRQGQMPKYIKLKEIISQAKNKFGTHFYGGVYFGRTYDLKYYTSPKGTDGGNIFWRLDEITPEMLELTFLNNSWYLESGDLMLDEF